MRHVRRPQSMIDHAAGATIMAKAIVSSRDVKVLMQKKTSVCITQSNKSMIENAIVMAVLCSRRLYGSGGGPLSDAVSRVQYSFCIMFGFCIEYLGS